MYRYYTRISLMRRTKCYCLLITVCCLAIVVLLLQELINDLDYKYKNMHTRAHQSSFAKKHLQSNRSMQANNGRSGLHRESHKYYSSLLRKKVSDKLQSVKIVNDSGNSSPSLLHNGYRRHSFNVTASDLIPVDRDLPDTRPQKCAVKRYDLIMLPHASVVICFHNEAWSTLIRTLHSVMAQTPAMLLADVILVDDASTMDYLGSRLSSYIRQFTSVHLYRTRTRLGLVGARLYGASFSSGNVLVFLDSHVEVNVQWLEPLLDRIAQNPAQILCPVIDIIDHQTFSYSHAPPDVYGVFDWQLRFMWKSIPKNILSEITDETELINTPAMVGGIFAVDKVYFYDIGSYDEGMKIWGGENIELSLRVWTCHGSVNIVPCSHVGHVFRTSIPYSFPLAGGAAYTIHMNSARTAEVWMDRYKWIYYASQPYEYPSDLQASLSDRKSLRRRLQCKNFLWYLENILPELVMPVRNAKYHGQIRSSQCGCLDVSGPTTLSCKSCETLESSQTFTLTYEGRLQQSDQCLVTTFDNCLGWISCHRAEYVWVHQKNRQIATSLNDASFCLGVTTGWNNTVSTVSHSVQLQRCNDDKSQLWTFTHRFDIDMMTNFDLTG